MEKTELVNFKYQKKKDSEVWIKLSRKSPTDSFKYLGIRIHKNLNWNHHTNDTAIKLSRAT